MATQKKITETGPIGLRGIRNSDLYGKLSAAAQDGNEAAASVLEGLSVDRIRPYSRYVNPEAYYTPQQYEPGTPYADLGNSKYDDPVIWGNNPVDVEEIRYENQPWYDTLANGIGKMLGTAATTFVSSLVGLPYGIGAAINEGRWSAIWDNDVTQALSGVDEWLEKNMTNYRSQVQKNSPWYSPENLFSMNFIADDIIKNAGFTLGAAASMAVGSGTLGLMSRAMNFVNDVSKGAKIGNKFVSALFSATGEGMIEAKQGVEERNKMELQKLEDALAPEKQALELEMQQVDEEYAANRGRTLVRNAEGRAIDPAYEEYKRKMSDLALKRDALNQKYEAGKQQIEESGKEMGNKILLGNQVLLTAGNIIQFSKAMGKSFDSARHAAEVAAKPSRSMPFGVTAKRVSDNIKDGYDLLGKKKGMAVAATKGFFTEGSEEMNQQFIQQASGAAYNEQDVNDYWRARLDPESYRETTKGLYTMGHILDRGFQESWGDINQWEQFFIGGVTGLAGTYSPTKLFNQDKTKSRWNPARYGSWEGGAYNEVRDFLNGTQERMGYNEYSQNVEELNRILASEEFPSRVRSLIAHTFTESRKEEAAANNDKKTWKDEDDKQTIHDIQAFLRAGKIDDLRAIYNSMGEDLTEEDIEKIVKSTTKETSAEEDKKKHDDAVDIQISAKKREIDTIQSKIEDLVDTRDSLEDSEDRSVYTDAARTKIEEHLTKIDKLQNDIDKLQQEKDSYAGTKYFTGSYVDEKGNRTSSDDEIRSAVKHNAEELNRKLDSYLESIAHVREVTGGTLTNDQEDNLAYLHNLGKESITRMQKIMSNVRKQLPSKFLLKTSKSVDQLTKENVTSDLVFSKDENTPEGYVEVDTSMMKDNAFATFFQREVMRGGNISPEFAETADERAAREREEENLSEDEKKAKARERASKKWKDAIQKMQDDAKEQWNENWGRLVDNFMDNYKINNDASYNEAVQAFGKVRQDLQDAADLFDQAGEYQKTLDEYMSNPGKVDEAKAKEEKKADKEQKKQDYRNKFVGKTAKEINQEIASGTLDEDEADDFSMADVNDDEELKKAQDEIKTGKKIRQKQAQIKQHIQESLGDNPTAEELSVAQVAMKAVDEAALAADLPDNLDINTPELKEAPFDEIDTNMTQEDIDALNQRMQDMLADAFTAYREDENAVDDIPDAAPSNEDLETGETGRDPVPQVDPIVNEPDVSPVENIEQVVPKNPLTEGALDNIIKAMNNVYERLGDNGILRSTTRRYIYGKSSGTYHEDIAKKEFGEDSIEYKRSKAIWEYLNNEGAFDRMENASADRIRKGDTLHLMVKYLPEVYGKDYSELTDEEKPFATVILMLNEKGEVLGDLPLAQFEPSFKSGKPNSQVKELLALQNKLFEAFDNSRKTAVSNEAIVDSTLKIDGKDNLNLTFNNAKKTPLVIKIKQVMKGVVPFKKSEKNTLNEVAQDSKLELGVRVTGENIALERGSKGRHPEIVLPHVGSIGQPYMLVPTASEEKIAVPFYMPFFDAEKHKNTELYRLLCNAVSFLAYSSTGSSTQHSNYFKKHIDVLEGLLQVKRMDKINAIEIKDGKLQAHLQSLTDENKVYNFEVPSTGNTAEDAIALVNQMSGIPINVSLQFLNNTIETGLERGKIRQADYNRVIGEIADINLPKSTRHTVNSWFTVELNPSANINRNLVKTRTTGTYTENIGGRNVEIDTDRLIAVDPVTEEQIDDDEEINLLLAQIKANKPQYKDKDFIQIQIGGDLRTYDVKQKKFVKGSKASQPKAEKQETPQAKEAQENPPVQEEKKEEIAATAERKAKTIEEIETDFKNSGVLNRQTRATWDAIPEDLKLAMVNGGEVLELEYGNKKETISYNNLKTLSSVLKDAAKEAKKGLLKVSKAAKPMEKSSAVISKENERQARRWLAKNLPTLSSEERTQFVEKLAREGKNAGKAWGNYRSGVVEIQRNAPMGTVYHEAFHYVIDMVLDSREKEAIMEIAKQEYGIDNNYAAEERLANDFRRYAMDENAAGIVGRIKRWIRIIKDKITRYNRISDATINQLFWKINNGELAQKATEVENYEERQQEILREIRNVQKEKYSWSNLESSTKKNLADSGVSEETYRQMSLEEKEQYIVCRG